MFFFQSFQLDSYVFDLKNYNTISLSMRPVADDVDKNKWTMNKKGKTIAGSLPDFDVPLLLSFKPRNPYDIFKNKVLISNILDYSFSVIDLTDKSTVKNSFDIFTTKPNINTDLGMMEAFEQVKGSEQIVNSLFIDDDRIMITSKAIRNNILELRHDIISYKTNKIIKTYYEPLDSLLTNKNILFGKNYVVSENKIIAFHYIPFTINENDKEYFIRDSVNSYYMKNPKVKTLIRVYEL